jgi:hypothetical protein
MSDTLTTEHLTREHYGDEATRLEELLGLEYPTYKQRLIDLHDSHPDIEPEGAFVDETNSTHGGEIFPRPEDKDQLLSYALEQAQTAGDLQVAALILATGIVFTHPFGEGNGRTSRAEYAYWSRGLDEDVDEYRHLRRTQGLGYRQDPRTEVNFGDIMDVYAEELISDVIFRESGFESVAEVAASMSRDSEAVKAPYNAEREYKGLTDTEADELDTLLGQTSWMPGRYAKLFANAPAWLYSLSKIHAATGSALSTGTTMVDGEVCTCVNLPDSLALMDRKTKLTFMDYLKEYYTLRAKAAIDLMGKYGNESANEVGHPEMSIRDYLVDKTNNYLASKLGKQPITAAY